MHNNDREYSIHQPEHETMQSYNNPIKNYNRSSSVDDIKQIHILTKTSELSSPSFDQSILSISPLAAVASITRGSSQQTLTATTSQTLTSIHFLFSATQRTHTHTQQYTCVPPRPAYLKILRFPHPRKKRKTDHLGM